MRLYKHGLPFSEILKTNIDDCIDRVNKKFASLLIVDGMIGKGKTTLAVHIADYINKAHGFPHIKFEEQLALGGEQFQEKLRIGYTKKYPCIIYDEAGDFNRRGALTRFNATLNRTFETFRAFKIIPILSLPLFTVLDKDLFDKGIPRCLIHIQSRTGTQSNFMGYSLWRMFYIRKKMEKLTVKPAAYQHTEPNFYAHALDLEPERSKELDNFSTAGKKVIQLTAELETSGLYSVPMMAKKFIKSENHIHNCIKKLKFMHKKKIKNTRLFTTDQCDALGEFLLSRGLSR